MRRALAAITLVVLGATSAHAQHWTFDARRIGMGNVSGLEQDYRVVVLPFGLLQVLRHRNVFDPDSDEFDLVRAVEYAASPLHYVVGRDDNESDSGRRLSVDIRNGRLSRDLNAYRGFVPARQPAAEGLAHNPLAFTLPVVRTGSGTMHGIRVGAGPYLSTRNAFSIDQRVLDILASDADVYVPNADLGIGIETGGQMAVALTAGYRGRVPLAATTGERDGVYLELDYHYLLGFRYERIDTSLQLQTDNAGLLTFSPVQLLPVTVARDHSSSGRGFAVDLGVGVVADPVELGVAVNGIANRIEWTDVERTTYGIRELFTGGDFGRLSSRAIEDTRVELPTDVRVYGGYRMASGLAAAEFARGFQGTSFHSGYEHQLGALAVRGGALYTRERWQPTAGLGVNMGRRVALDVAVFGTSANVERRRRAGIAVSLRFARE